MRVDPDAIYAELSSGALIVNPKTGKSRSADVVVLHWRSKRKWKRGNLIADEGETIGSVLRNLGDYLDKGGLDALHREMEEA